MSEESRNYKGSTLLVRMDNPEPRDSIAGSVEVTGLYVDGQFVPTMANTATGGHWTYLLPYEEFNSLMSMGEAVVNHVYGRAINNEDGN